MLVRLFKLINVLICCCHNAALTTKQAHWHSSKRFNRMMISVKANQRFKAMETISGHLLFLELFSSCSSGFSVENIQLKLFQNKEISNGRLTFNFTFQKKANNVVSL